MEYKSKGAVPGADTAVSFETKAILLDIPSAGAVVSGGWLIVCLTPLIVSETFIVWFNDVSFRMCNLASRSQRSRWTISNLDVGSPVVKCELLIHPLVMTKRQS